MSTSTELSVPVIGERLPNGAFIVAIHRDHQFEEYGDMRPQGVVLAWSRDSYVTWRWIRHDSGEILTYGGHYFLGGEGLFAAVKDYTRRSKT